MRVTTLAPSSELAPFVRSMTVVETDDEETRVLIPDTGIVLGFRYGGRADQIEGAQVMRVPDVSVTGLRHTARRMRTSAGGGVILATLREGAGSVFFRAPMHELFGETVALPDLLPASAVARTAERIARVDTLRDRAAAFERFLLEQRRRHEIDPLVAHAARMIRRSGGTIRVRTLADHLGIGMNRLEDRFRHAVGASPKAVASIVRLRAAVAGYRAGDTLTQLSVQAGYADQSHFTRDFRGRMGAPPRRLLGSDEYC